MGLSPDCVRGLVLHTRGLEKHSTCPELPPGTDTLSISRGLQSRQGGRRGLSTKHNTGDRCSLGMMAPTAEFTGQGAAGWWGLSLPTADVLSSFQTRRVQPLSTECSPLTSSTCLSSCRARTHLPIAHCPASSVIGVTGERRWQTQALFPCLLRFLSAPSLSPFLACLYSILSPFCRNVMFGCFTPTL